jgi:hypothetical protein
MKDPKLASYLDAVQKGYVVERPQGLPLDHRREDRRFRFGEGHSTSDLRALYGALIAGYAEHRRANGPKAVAAFNRANNLNRQQQQLIQGSLTRILGKDGNLKPEAAASAVQTMTQGGKVGGDLKTLAEIKRATVKSGAWDEIASTLIHLGGQPAKSEGREFNPETFVNWYADMSEQARSLLFKPELRQSLDGFVAVNQQLSRLRGLKNNSNTTPTIIGAGVVSGGGVALMTHPMALLAIAGGWSGQFRRWASSGRTPAS